MNVLMSPKPSFFHHPHDINRRSPTRSMSPFHNAGPGHRKRKADDEPDEMSVSPSSSPAVQYRQLSRPSKKVRSSDPTGRPLSLPRLLETLDVTQLRTVLQTICERQPDIAEEVVKGAPRPSVESALQVLNEYQTKLQAAFPYGGSGSDYTYFRVRQPLLALVDALSDFTAQYLPPNEAQTTVSLQFLDGATKLIHNLPEWDSQGYRHHKENAYDEISKAWALVITEASKKGAGFSLHSDGWDQNLMKHNEQSGGRLHTAMSAMASNVGWVGGSSNIGTPNTMSNPTSILDQLVAGNYASVRVGPCPGDQHSSIANPFEEAKPRISEFTAAEIATLQVRLEKQLGPEYLSARSGPSGQKVHYIAAEKCIALANEVFGFNGWSSSIQNIQVDFVDENPQTLKISLGLSVIVRVTLRDGTFHEDIGYGHIENCKGKAAAFEKAKKEGTTDALKRTLRNFGNVLGNCIYDKDYLSKVTKIKVGPTRFDEENLYRHSDFAKKEQDIVKVEPKAVADRNSGQASASVLSDALALEEDFGDFDMADFGVTEDGHPDEVVLPGSHDHAAQSSDKSQTAIVSNASDRNRPPMNRNMQPPSKPVAQQPRPPQTPNQQANKQAHRPGGQFQGRPNPQQQPPRQNNYVNITTQQAAANNRVMTPPPNAVSRPPSGMNVPIGISNEPATFFSARSVKDVPDTADPGTAVSMDRGAKVFDPRAESPSIRKTPGIDHRSSKPLSKGGVHVPPIKRELDQQRPAPNGPPNVVNPSLSQVRQIGAPGGAGSPLGNRGQYRPPTMKRPPPGGPDGGGNRTPLTEVSANGPTAAGAVADAKRQKMT
ncbi:hypothetical protein F5Y09DRAFT_336209 [Xylaria sp. FL1042]|nr:hypothetical protein F5Y09DRAFT_336209 [Xylaria sp. FL1042]